jgi:hypothetical protein
MRALRSKDVASGKYILTDPLLLLQLKSPGNLPIFSHGILSLNRNSPPAIIKTTPKIISNLPNWGIYIKRMRDEGR